MLPKSVIREVGVGGDLEMLMASRTGVCGELLEVSVGEVCKNGKLE